MRALAATVIAFMLAGAASAPAEALEFCDNIKEPDKRMACLQERISSLEETLLALSNQVVDLRNALRQKLDADAVYKLQQVAEVVCLGISGKDRTLDLQSCDHPDSWKLLPGGQKPGKEDKKKKKKDN
jgi:hypothetical protein